MALFTARSADDCSQGSICLKMNDLISNLHLLRIPFGMLVPRFVTIMPIVQSASAVKALHSIKCSQIEKSSSC